MKNAFYFTLKALFVLKIFKFLPWLFSHVEKHLQNYKVYDVTDWIISNYNTHVTHIIHIIIYNISRGKGNQTMKFDHLREHNMKHFFGLKKSYTKCGEETSPKPFPKKWKLSISQLCFKQFVFYHMSKLRDIEIYWI